MSSGSGGGSGSKGGMLGGAKKVIAVGLAIFVVMAIVPNIDSLMATAEAFGSAVAGVFDAVGTVLGEITAAFEQTTGE